MRQAGATLHRGARASLYCGLSCCGAQAPDAQAQQLWLTGLVAPRHVGSSQTGARTRVPCIDRQILNHCATREAPSTCNHYQNLLIKDLYFILSFSNLACGPLTALSGQANPVWRAQQHICSNMTAAVVHQPFNDTFCPDHLCIPPQPPIPCTVP